MHNIPEGICVAMPIYYATGSRWKVRGPAGGGGGGGGAVLGTAALVSAGRQKNSERNRGGRAGRWAALKRQAPYWTPASWPAARACIHRRVPARTASCRHRSTARLLHALPALPAPPASRISLCSASSGGPSCLGTASLCCVATLPCLTCLPPTCLALHAPFRASGGPSCRASASRWAACWAT